MRAASGLHVQRWAEGYEYLRLCRAELRRGHYPQAVKYLDEAHNLGRDNIVLHAKAHFAYVRFSLHGAEYRRAIGHLFWAVVSPLMVPIERRRRTAIVGEWTPAPRNLTS